MRTISLLLNLFLLLILAGEASACGVTLTRSITLTRDYACAGFPYAFKVAAPGVTISLNGRRVSGDGGQDGIVAVGVTDLSIRGPGQLEWFDHAIRVERATRVRVTGVEIRNALSSGVALANSSLATIENNRFSGFMEVGAIDIRQPVGLAGSSAGSNIIRNNFVQNAFRGLNVCGAAAGNNRIISNSFQQIIEVGISLSHEADGNWVEGNKFGPGATVSIESSSHNTVIGNVFDRTGAYGLRMAGGAHVSCVATPGGGKATNNLVSRNTSYATDFPFVLSLNAVANTLQFNTVHAAAIGLRFESGSSGNDARFNTFVDTLINVRDDGSGNIY